MKKTRRPVGITALAFGSVVTGLYSQVASAALLLGGTVSGLLGASDTRIVLVLGAIFFGLMVAAYLVGFGFWTQRRWSWAGGIVVFATLIAASVLLASAGSVLSATALVIGAGAAIAYLLRPATRAWLLGTSALGDSSMDDAPTPKGPALEAPQSAQ
jgi:O-antigen ligase